MGLLFALRVYNDGYEVDTVTPKKQTFVICESAMGNLTGAESNLIYETLQNNNVWFKLHERSVKHDSHFALQPKDMFLVIRLLEAVGFRIQEVVPYFVWKAVCAAEERPTIATELIRARIGPEKWDQLHDYQKVGVQKMIELKKCYCGDEMGTGKTLQSLMVSYYYREHWPALIICPSSLRYNWKAEILHWIDDVNDTQIFVVRTGKDMKKIKPAHQFVIISYNLLIRPEVTDAIKDNFDLVVLDEAHYVKSMTSKRSSATLQVTQKCTIKILLSGTPFNYPVEMFQQIKLIDPTIYPWFFNYTVNAIEEPGKYYYATRYCKPTKVLIRNAETWNFRGYDRSEELNAVLNTFLIRRKKSDVLSQLPPKNRICITLPPLTKKQQGEIDVLLNGGEKKTKKKSKKESKRGVKDTTIGKSPEAYMEAFRLASQFKTPHVTEFVKDQIIDDLLANDENLKVLIFFHHKAMCDALRECLDAQEIKYFLIDGSTNGAKRQEYVDTFQNTQQHRVALLSITACSTGLTLTRASLVVFTEILFGAENHVQAEDRAHRIGQKNDVNIFYLIQPGTTDDINFGLIKKKERESSFILEGSHAKIGGDMASERFRMPDEEKSLTQMLQDKKHRQEQHAPEATLSKRQKMVIVRKIIQPPQTVIRVLPGLEK